MATRQLAHEIETLMGSSRDELRARFIELHRAAPPKRMGTDLLRRAVAHRIQAKARGGSHATLRRRLARLADELKDTGRITMHEHPPVKPGTRLIREWQGETHEVMVMEGGYAWRGERYRSLSRIARLITGAHRSGPAFFGLRNRDGTD